MTNETSKNEISKSVIQKALKSPGIFSWFSMIQLENKGVAAMKTNAEAT
jgi:hypothetical protein